MDAPYLFFWRGGGGRDKVGKVSFQSFVPALTPPSGALVLLRGAPQPGEGGAEAHGPGVIVTEADHGGLTPKSQSETKPALWVVPVGVQSRRPPAGHLDQHRMLAARRSRQRALGRLDRVNVEDPDVSARTEALWPLVSSQALHQAAEAAGLTHDRHSSSAC